MRHPHTIFAKTALSIGVVRGQGSN